MLRAAGQPLSSAETGAVPAAARANPVCDDLRQRLAGLVGKQPAVDPAAAAQALLKIVDFRQPTLRVLLGISPMLQ